MSMPKLAQAPSAQVARPATGMVSIGIFDLVKQDSDYRQSLFGAKEYKGRLIKLQDILTVNRETYQKLVDFLLERWREDPEDGWLWIQPPNASSGHTILYVALGHRGASLDIGRAPSGKKAKWMAYVRTPQPTEHQAGIAQRH